VHKRRNISNHVPEELQRVVDCRLAGTVARTEWMTGLEQAKAIARDLKADHPDAAPSRLEGLQDMFTVHRLGITGTLARSLTTTNAIESMISIARTTARKQTRWRDGEVKKRWVAAGMLEAERSFRRLKDHRDLPKLLAALRARRVGADPAKEYARAIA
jgi:putative transposase